MGGGSVHDPGWVRGGCQLPTRALSPISLKTILEDRSGFGRLLDPLPDRWGHVSPRLVHYTPGSVLPGFSRLDVGDQSLRQENPRATPGSLSGLYVANFLRLNAAFSHDGRTSADV